MKKYLNVMLVLLVVLMLLLSACREPAAEGENGEEPKPTYKETMLPFEELIPAERIVFLQNTLNYSREGFYNAENKPVTEEIAYDGATVEAYPMTYALNFLHNPPEGDLIIHNNDGSTATIAAEDFKGLYVLIDFTEDSPPLLFNPQTGAEFTDFLFVLTAEGEAIYSVVSDSIHNAAGIIAAVGWDPEKTYRYMATDKFYIPVEPADHATGEIRGALSGAINGSFPDLAIASGKINDVIYVEAME